MINVITLLYERILRQLMIGMKIDEKQAQELKKKYSFYLEKKIFNMKITQFRVEDVFGVLSTKGTFSEQKIIRLKKFSAKMM